MTEEMTEDKTKEELNEAKSNNEDFPMVEWHAEGPFVYDPHNNVVCECYQLGCYDQDYGVAWAKRNAREIVFLHNDRLAMDKIISQATQHWEGSKRTGKENYE